MDIQDIKKRYAEAYIEDFGDFEIVHIDKEELDWLIEQAEKVERLERVNLVATHLMTDKQLEKLKQLINK